jgi:hypothetical protein
MIVEQVNDLKLEVERTFGRRILTSADCNELSDHVQQKTGFRLSFNTLRRFFHLIKSEFSPSSNTLNILTKYCGYTSLDNFIRSKENASAQISGQSDAKLMKYLVLQFINIEVQHYNDATYLSMVRQTINFLNSCPHIIDQFQREIAKTKNGQTFYFEYFVNIDKLISYYGDGLQYYLNEKKTREAQLFGHSLLCFRYWLANDIRGVEKHYEEVMKYKIDDTIHLFVCARYFTAQIYQANISGKKNETILIHVREFYNQLKTNKGLVLMLPCFLMNISEALLLVGEHKEALYYIEEAIKKYDERIGEYVDDKVFHALPLYQALALARLGEMTKAKKLLNAIKPDQFYFLWKQYLTILYIHLKELLQQTKPDRAQIEFIIEETGFVKLLPDK